MLMPDVNILVYAHRGETRDHKRYAEWLTNLVVRDEPFALSELVLAGFVRIVTNQKIFRPASTVAQAFEFISVLLDMPGACLIRPGERHFALYQELCLKYRISAKLSADAYHAALAIEHGCEWVSADTDFAPFSPELRFSHL